MGCAVVLMLLFGSCVVLMLLPESAERKRERALSDGRVRYDGPVRERDDGEASGAWEC